MPSTISASSSSRILRAPRSAQIEVPTTPAMTIAQTSGANSRMTISANRPPRRSIAPNRLRKPAAWMPAGPVGERDRRDDHREPAPSAGRRRTGDAARGRRCTAGAARRRSCWRVSTPIAPTSRMPRAEPARARGGVPAGPPAARAPGGAAGLRPAVRWLTLQCRWRRTRSPSPWSSAHPPQVRRHRRPTVPSVARKRAGRGCSR